MEEKTQNQNPTVYSTLIQEYQVPSGLITPRMLAATPAMANGDIYYSNGSSFVRLPKGSDYQTLVVLNNVPAWINFPQTGVAASKPSSGRFTGDQYFATDSFVFSVWTGAAWKSATLT